VPDAIVPTLVSDEPVTVAASEAPVNVLAAADTVQLPPSAQLCPFTVVDALASAVLGIEVAVTLNDGALVAFATLGVSHDGQLDVAAAKLFTVPGVPPSTSVSGAPPPHTARCPVVGAPVTTGTFPPPDVLNENEFPLNDQARVDGL
jgi:hypothetical protein